jgi:hypothetical protein
MPRIYSTLYKSVVRATSDLIKEIEATTGDLSLKYWDWENRSDEDKLPRVPLLGVNGFSFDENGGLWLVRFGLTLSTIDDDHLLKEADMIDAIHAKFGEGNKVAMRDPTSGTVINELVVAAFEVAPMGQTQMRNYRSVAVEILRTGTDD